MNRETFWFYADGRPKYYTLAQCFVEDPETKKRDFLEIMVHVDPKTKQPVITEKKDLPVPRNVMEIIKKVTGKYIGCRLNEENLNRIKMEIYEKLKSNELYGRTEVN